MLQIASGLSLAGIFQLNFFIVGIFISEINFDASISANGFLWMPDRGHSFCATVINLGLDVLGFVVRKKLLVLLIF
jgi:hypothetical protein